MNRMAATREILSDLIAHPTVSTESNLELIVYLANRLGDLGARVDIFHDKTGRKANLWATLGPDRDGGIILSGHTDVVPVADQDWTTDPFETHERAGLIFGRGTCDMKGFIAAAMAMAPEFAAQELRRPIHFCFTHDEETGCMGAQALLPHLQDRGIRPAMAIIGEPTDMRIIEGHKGCCEYTARFTGLEGHGSAPDRGVNAAEYAVRYVSRLLELREELKPRAPASSRFDPPWTTLNVGGIRGGVAHNVIVGRAEVDWEFRPVQQSDLDFVKQAVADHVDKLLGQMRAVHPAASIETEVIGEVEGLEPMDDNEARALVAELTGANTADVAPFGTEAGIFTRLGLSAVVCGPGSIDQAHKPDEYVSLDQLDRCLDMLEGLRRKLAA
ncbi:acetylornithine deacetylase [Mesobacterium pallidum]|uniref:acetylornithine deacetylase n=1 Tax=Mesobacterium pallidum TaxID=2872037 RepID=UPI001EE2C26C|nr:acetylornithine deacetylase [Mesobacterium pallidum]